MCKVRAKGSKAEKLYFVVVVVLFDNYNVRASGDVKMYEKAIYR